MSWVARRHGAAVVAVPDAYYGEVVGAWIVRDPHLAHLSREQVRKVVATAMNPQVRRMRFVVLGLAS